MYLHLLSHIANYHDMVGIWEICDLAVSGVNEYIWKTMCPTTYTWAPVIAGDTSLSFTIESCVCGYQDIWNSRVGEY